MSDPSTASTPSTSRSPTSSRVTSSAYDRATDLVELKTCDGRPFGSTLTANTFAEMRAQPGRGVPGRDRRSCATCWSPAACVYAYGVFIRSSGRAAASTSSTSCSSGRQAAEFHFERPDWWVQQIDQLADFYLRREFGDGPIDYRELPHHLDAGGQQARHDPPGDRHDLPPGLRVRLRLPAAPARIATSTRRRRAPSTCATTCASSTAARTSRYWYHGIDVRGDAASARSSPPSSATTTTPSPCYEQIYALAGPDPDASGSPATRGSVTDIDATVDLFDTVLHSDPTTPGGYYSHIDPVTFDPLSRALGRSTGTARTGTPSATTSRPT